MDDTRGVGRAERVDDLNQILERPLEIESPGLDGLSERLSGYELHRDVQHRRPERHAVSLRRAFTDVVDRNEMGMVQRRRGSRFLHETVEPVRVPGHVLAEDLQSQVAAKYRITSQVDFAHPTTGEQAHHLEAPDCGVGEVWVGDHCHRDTYFSPCRDRTSSSHERTSDTGRPSERTGMNTTQCVRSLTSCQWHAI